MTIQILKSDVLNPTTGEGDIQQIVQTKLHEIEQGSEDSVREYARTLGGGWEWATSDTSKNQLRWLFEVPYGACLLGEWL